MAYYTYIHKSVVPPGIKFKIILENLYNTLFIVSLTLTTSPVSNGRIVM